MQQMLIADDNPQLLDILRTAAEKEGYQVILARDGEKALSQFRRQQAHIQVSSDEAGTVFTVSFPEKGVGEEVV